MNLDHEKASVAEFEELKFALRDMVALSSKLSLRLIVMEAAVAEVISSMPTQGRSDFASKFKSRIARLMQIHANRLLPFDDAEITRAMADVLSATRLSA